MESEKCRKIREILELFEVDTKKIIGDLSIIGHLAKAFDEIVIEKLRM